MSQDVDSALVRKLAGLLEETGLGELEYATRDWRIRVVRPVASAATLPVPERPVAHGPEVSDSQSVEGPVANPAHLLKSPMVGTVYLAPDPDAAPFVAAGATVTAGQTVMIIEAMKIMNSIPAHRSGIVKQVMVVNGQPVEFDEILMVIE